MLRSEDLLVVVVFFRREMLQLQTSCFIAEFYDRWQMSFYRACINFRFTRF